MMITKEHLDMRICDVVDGADNTETFRDFIRNSEEEFDLMQKELDGMTDKQLSGYLDFLDYLWEK